MANFTISNLNDGARTRPRDRASGHGRSVEEETRLLISSAVGHAPRRRDLASVIRSHFGPTNRVGLDPPLPEGLSVAVLRDAMPSPDRPAMYALRLWRTGFRTIRARRRAGPGEMRACVPDPGWPAGRGEA